MRDPAVPPKAPRDPNEADDSHVGSALFSRTLPTEELRVSILNPIQGLHANWV
jgi:hypothetical protein